MYYVWRRFDIITCILATIGLFLALLVVIPVSHLSTSSTTINYKKTAFGEDSPPTQSTHLDFFTWSSLSSQYSLFYVSFYDITTNENGRINLSQSLSRSSITTRITRICTGHERRDCFHLDLCMR